jgi:ABC-type multidrug transport system fused ATPase/permease subunit
VLEARKGKITIDGIDISKLNLPDLRKRIILINQDPTLFEDTLRVNLDPDSKLDDAELWGILQKVGLKEVFQGR